MGMLALACAGDPAPAHPTVALVTIDTWRRDHFSAAHTPRLWALAEAGERFDDAWSPIGLTSPAHATMLTGALPWEHGMEANNHHGYRLAAEAETVAEAFAARGWATGAFVSAWPAGPAGGLDQGFATFSGPASGERPGAVAVAEALAWLPDDQPAFVWVHVYEPHGPYEGQSGSDPERYAEEVLRADAALAPLIDALVSRRARVVVAADHGEVLLEERCGRQHERSTHDVVLRVPLVRWQPEGQPQVHAQRVGLNDVRALLEGLPADQLPHRDAWVAESGTCEAGCSPGCRPDGLLGRDRVVIDPGGRWVRRPGRGVFTVGQPDPGGRALLEAVPPMQPPAEAADAASLEALGYRAP